MRGTGHPDCGLSGIEWTKALTSYGKDFEPEIKHCHQLLLGSTEKMVLFKSSHRNWYKFCGELFDYVKILKYITFNSVSPLVGVYHTGRLADSMCMRIIC